MKIMGINCGRPGGNTEVLLKEALMACEAQGAEVIWLNLHDAKINPCTGCEACMMQVMMKKQPPKCIFSGKDDMDAIMAEMASCDGLIVSIPSFTVGPHGLWKVFTDRWLPYEWALQIKAGVVDKAPERVAGIICTGGATLNWQTLTLAGLGIPMFMQSFKVVDMMMGKRMASPGHVSIVPKYLEQAHKLGENVANACKLPYDEVKYAGEMQGWCPVCHNNLMLKAEPHWDGLSYKYECAMCSAGGDFELDENGELKFVLAPNGLEHCRLFNEGRANHLDELGEIHEEFFKHRAEVMEAMGKYKAYQPRRMFKD